MSQRDLVAELRAARVEAPSDVRQRVRLIAAQDTTRTRRFTWRRALVVAVPVAAVIAAAVVFNRPSHSNTPVADQAERGIVHGVAAGSARTGAPAPNLGATLQKTFAAPAPYIPRVQRYAATLGLRVVDAAAVSRGVQQALRITHSLGGYESAVHTSLTGSQGSADLVLRIPRSHVQEAVAKLGRLGKVTSEQVDVQDLTAGLNATDRTIALLQKQLAALRAEPTSPMTTARIAALVARIQSLQRGEASTTHTAHYATVRLHFGTAAAVHKRTHHGPLHALVVALEWLGIGALYAVVLGLPVLLVAWLAWFLVRLVRRRREDALLSS